MAVEKFQTGDQPSKARALSVAKLKQFRFMPRFGIRLVFPFSRPMF